MSETSLVLRSSIVAGPDGDPLAVGRLEHQPVGGLLDRQAGDDAAVGQGQDQRAEVVADRRARVQDRAEQLVLAVLGADRREVGADPLALALDAVAARRTSSCRRGRRRRGPCSASPSRRISSPIGGSGRPPASLGQRQDRGRLVADAGGRGDV